MSKTRMSARSRRMVRRNRRWFELMDDTGLTSAQLRTFLDLRDSLAEAVSRMCDAFVGSVSAFADAASEAGRKVADGLLPTLEAAAAARDEAEREGLLDDE